MSGGGLPTRIRPGTSRDLAFLRAMLFEAAYWRAGERPSLEVGLSTPELAPLLAEWGRPGDLAVIAESESQQMGAAWLRRWDDRHHSYGYVSSEVPELGLGVAERFRRRGVGRLLLERLLTDAARAGAERVSLSVERDNPALRLYQAIGFTTVEVVGDACTMVIRVSDPR